MGTLEAILIKSLSQLIWIQTETWWFVATLTIFILMISMASFYYGINNKTLHFKIHIIIQDN